MTTPTTAWERSRRRQENGVGERLLSFIVIVWKESIRPVRTLDQRSLERLFVPTGCQESSMVDFRDFIATCATSHYVSSTS
jgi:hypothetical protein